MKVRIVKSTVVPSMGFDADLPYVLWIRFDIESGESATLALYPNSASDGVSLPFVDTESGECFPTLSDALLTIRGWDIV